MIEGWRFHHFGLAAADPARAVGFVEALGYRCGAPVHDPLQSVELRWCEHAAAPPIEVVSADGGPGPLQRLLAARDSSFYHLCFEVPGGIESAASALQAAGIRQVVVRAPLPAVLFGGRRVSFHQVQGFGLVELLEAAAP